MKIVLGIFLIAHGLVHIAIWAAPTTDDGPMRPAHSWVLGEVRPLALTLALAAGVVLATAGVGYLTGAGWWPWAVMIGAGVSVVLMAVTFTPWWLAGLAIDAGLVIWAVGSQD